MPIYWMILISNANADLQIVASRLSMQNHRGCPISSYQTHLICLHHVFQLETPTTDRHPVVRPRGQGWAPDSSTIPTHLVKSPSNPAPREHTQTNKHSTGEHKACSATVLPTLASRHMRVRSAAAAAGRQASDYRGHPVRKGQKGRTERMARGKKARSVLTVRHLVNKQRRCRWLRIGGCEMRWGSRRRMWPAPGDYLGLSPVRMCSAVAGGLVVVAVSQV